MDLEILSHVEKVLAAAELDSKSESELEKQRVEWFGKEGVFRVLFDGLRHLSPEEKPAIAQRINQVRDLAQNRIDELITALGLRRAAAKLASERLDLTLPAKTQGYGRRHPITRVEEEIAVVLTEMGFRHVDGPEVEDEYYCFDSLNIPKFHPARDMQDTFYTDAGRILRTHTSSAQTRELENRELPIKIACSGRVYRNEAVDATHSDMFHQYEAMWVDKGVQLPHLIDTLTQILRALYGRNRKIKFVPKFYPYTEPSIGALVQTYDGSGWATVAGAGMIHKKVLEEFDYETGEISGFAFGLGTSRLVAERFGIPTMRALYDNDLRVLQSLA